MALILTSADEYEPYIERFKIIFKGCCRICFATLPFDKIPHCMVIELVYLQIFWLDFFIPAGYISNTMGPGSLICDRAYYYNLICGKGAQYGEHVKNREKTQCKYAQLEH